MKTEEIIVANLSCSGCVNTITKNLKLIEGVENVTIDLETNIVRVQGKDELNRDLLTLELHSLGYPEATEKNGLLTKIKSITSCLSGRFSN